MDVVEVEGLRLRCVLGVSDEERRDRQDVLIDLGIGTDAAAAMETDDVTAVLNYRTVTKAVIALVEASAWRTVERLAGEIARLVVVDEAAPYVRVRVRKPGALRFADAVGIVLERRPEDYPTEAARPVVAAGVGGAVVGGAR